MPLRMVKYKFPAGKPVKEAIPDSEIDRAKSLHNALVEIAAMKNEEGMERYFGRRHIERRRLSQRHHHSPSQSAVFPVFCIWQAPAIWEVALRDSSTISGLHLRRPTAVG